MGMLTSQGGAIGRRLVLFTGILLIAIGGIWTWLDRDRSPTPTPEASLERATRVHETRARPAETAAPDPDGAEPEYERLRASLDFTQAPQPLPHRVVREDFEVFSGTTGDFLVWLFDAVGFNAEKVAAGETTAIPPVVVLRVPKGWADEKSVQLKKSLFYRTLLPVILLENDAILAERAELEAYRKDRLNRAPIAPAAQARAWELGVKYRVIEEGGPGVLDDAGLEELMLRVDAVPPSLALAQAASESGYGTSRFAHTGNALFGQWDWSADAIKPEQQREGKGNYGIKAFPYPADSVRAYLWNLNTHRTYGDFRQLRAEQRDGREGRVALDGHALAATLLSYSERGEEYTKEIQGILSHNRLELADGLRVLRAPTLYFD